MKKLITAFLVFSVVFIFGADIFLTGSFGYIVDVSPKLTVTSQNYFMFLESKVRHILLDFCHKVFL